MKRIFVLLAVLAAVALVLSGCAAQHEEVKETVTEKDFVPAHNEIYTTTEYRYNLLGEDGFVLVPITRSMWVGDRYTVTVRIEYDDGDSTTETRTVTEDEWKSIQVGDDLLELWGCR